MENVLLIILLILALGLIGVVLLQRSEGGGLGIGGGGGGGIMSARGAATALSKLTWILGGLFMAVAFAMYVLSASQLKDRSVIDRAGTEPATEEAPAAPAGGLLPPTQGGDEPLTPPRAD